MERIITTLAEFIDEILNDFALVEPIKHMLVLDKLVDKIEFNRNKEKAWKTYVNNQRFGESENIVNSIKNNFPIVKKVVGEIKLDEPYFDIMGNEKIVISHHWIMIGDKIYDFSKGTLRDYIYWENIYDVKSEEWRYRDFEIYWK